MQTALHLNAILGVNSLPKMKNEKRSNKRWTEWQFKKMDETTISNFDYSNGILLITGSYCGLGNLDFDVKDNKGTILPERLLLRDKFICGLIDKRPDIYNSTVHESTPSGGFHIWYSANKIGEMFKINDVSGLGLIEVRENKCLTVCYPTVGYNLINNNFDKLKLLSDEQYDWLIAYASSFGNITQNAPTKVPKKENNISKVAQTSSQRITNIKPITKNIDEENIRKYKDENNPIMEYNNNWQDHAIDLLLINGWQIIGNRDSESFNLQRPFKDGKGGSANFNREKKGMYVFTTNDKLFEANHWYPCSQIFCLLTFGNSSPINQKKTHDEIKFIVYGKGKLKHKYGGYNSFKIKVLNNLKRLCIEEPLVLINSKLFYLFTNYVKQNRYSPEVYKRDEFIKLFRWEAEKWNFVVGSGRTSKKNKELYYTSFYYPLGYFEFESEFIKRLEFKKSIAEDLKELHEKTGWNKYITSAVPN